MRVAMILELFLNMHLFLKKDLSLIVKCVFWLTSGFQTDAFQKKKKPRKMKVSEKAQKSHYGEVKM
jgi:hypothetical protein